MRVGVRVRKYVTESYVSERSVRVSEVRRGGE